MSRYIELKNRSKSYSDMTIDNDYGLRLLGEKGQRIKHAVLIIGAGPAGVEAAKIMADSGMYVTLVDAQKNPGGTVIEGHCPLLEKTSAYLDDMEEVISHPLIKFVSDTRVGKDVEFSKLSDRGYSALIEASGATQDRKLMVQGAHEYLGKGFAYQVPLRTKFNESIMEDWLDFPFKVFDKTYLPQHVKEYYLESERRAATNYFLNFLDGATVIGGGRGAVATAEILACWCVAAKLYLVAGEDNTMQALIRNGVLYTLEDNNLSLRELNLRGSTILHWENVENMNLFPAQRSPELRNKAIRRTIAHLKREYGIRVLPHTIVEEIRGVEDRVSEVVVRNSLSNNQVIKTGLVVSAIGTEPTMISGLDDSSCDIPIFYVGAAKQVKGLAPWGGVSRLKQDVRKDMEEIIPFIKTLPMLDTASRYQIHEFENEHLIFRMLDSF